MKNYYDEIKDDILEVLEDVYSGEHEYLEENKDMPKYDLCDYLYESLFNNDDVTGNLSKSYYFSSYKSRIHCYDFSRDVEESLEEFGYKKNLERFKTFVIFVENGYLNIEDMTLNVEALQENYDNDMVDIICCDFEEYIEPLDFEKLDVITRCYKLPEVLADVLDSYLD